MLGVPSASHASCLPPCPRIHARPPTSCGQLLLRRGRLVPVVTPDQRVRIRPPELRERTRRSHRTWTSIYWRGEIAITSVGAKRDSGGLMTRGRPAAASLRLVSTALRVDGVERHPVSGRGRVLLAVRDDL